TCSRKKTSLPLGRACRWGRPWCKYRWRTVQAEQPRRSATSWIVSGNPSGRGATARVEICFAGYGQCCGFLCPRLESGNPNVSAAFAVSSKPYFSPSASCLSLIASLLSPDRPSDELPKPFREQAPEPPEDADKDYE